MSRDRIARWWSEYRNDAILALGVALLVFIAFGLGRATAPKPRKAPLTIEPLRDLLQSQSAQLQGSVSLSSGAKTLMTTEPVVASKNGTKYYLPTCSGANRIKEENKIWFSSIEEARSQGYTPAANCPGLR